MNETEFAGVVCARICHDLVGAVVNGADLIGELGQANAGEEMALVMRSARRAAAMLKLYRLAFGPAVDPAVTLGRDQLFERVTEVIVGPRLQFTCNALVVKT
jgi:histidine phosphotransferase ChpT